MCTTPWAFGIGLLFAWVGTLSLGGVGASWGLFLVFCQKVWYSVVAVGPPQREEVNSLEYIISLMVSVTADVIAYFVCKWLDRNP